MIEPTDSITIFPAVSVDCLACEFTVERLLDALQGGTFRFCGVHMLRVATHLTESGGERFLTPVR